MLQLTYKDRQFQIAHTILSKREILKIIKTLFKLFCRTIVTKSAQHWHQNRRVEQWKGTEA